MSSDRTIRFLTKPDCPLCDEALEALEPLIERWNLRIEKVDIRQDEALFAAHRYRIPVAEFRGEELGWGRLSSRAIERRLELLLEGDRA